MVEVRVGIVSWNTADLLARCLDAVPAALAGLDAEVVVVDNASGDASAAVAGARPGVTVIANAVNAGYARAMNQALAGTTAPVLIALNPDTEPAAGSLAALVAELRRHPGAGLVVPRLAGAGGARQHSVYRFPTLAVAALVSFAPAAVQRGWVGRRWWLEAASVPGGSGPVDWAVGAVHVIRASALGGEPPYRERWFMYVEDLDLCWRLHRAGWEVRLDAGVTVAHQGNASGAQAWGGSRARRFWAATYDFVGLTRGRRYARLLAAVNVAGAATHLAANAAGGRWPGPRRADRRRVAGELRAVLPVHARVAACGPAAPDATGHIPGAG